LDNSSYLPEAATPYWRKYMQHRNATKQAKIQARLADGSDNADKKDDSMYKENFLFDNY